MKKGSTKKQSAKKQKFSRLTVRVPSYLLRATRIMAGIHNSSLDEMVESALNSEFEGEWDDELREIGKKNPQLAEEISEKIFGPKKGVEILRRFPASRSGKS